MCSVLKELLISPKYDRIQEGLNILTLNGITVNINISEEKKAKSQKIIDTKWPLTISKFMAMQSISRIVPGSRK